MQEKIAVIIGANGGFGRFFAGRLTAAGWAVDAVDLEMRGDDASPYVRQLVVRPNASSREVDARLRRCSLLMLCLPKEATFQWIDRAARVLPADSLCVDILSVKTEVTLLAAGAGLKGEYLSLHPMFAPTAESKGGAMAAIPVRDGELTADFLTQLEQWGHPVTRLTAQQHDRAAAVLQASAHAVLLAFGRAVAQSAVEPEILEALSTPVADGLSTLVDRMLKGDPEVYRAIQRENPYARAARAQLALGLAELETPEGVARLWQSIGDGE